MGFWNIYLGTYLGTQGFEEPRCCSRTRLGERKTFVLPHVKTDCKSLVQNCPRGRLTCSVGFLAQIPFSSFSSHRIEFLLGWWTCRCPCVVRSKPSEPLYSILQGGQPGLLEATVGSGTQNIWRKDWMAHLLFLFSFYFPLFFKATGSLVLFTCGQKLPKNKQFVNIFSLPIYYMLLWHAISFFSDFFIVAKYT